MLLALDLSKRSCGWAMLAEGADTPRYGHVVLGSEFTSSGQTYVKLHWMLSDLRSVCRFERMFYEEAINPAALSGHTNIDTLRVLAGLVAHVESFGSALGIRTDAVNNTTWRRHFLGKMPRGSKTKDLKDYCIERCRQYGWKPKNSDEADALGILDWACEARGILPAWRADEVLRQPLGKVA